MRTQDELVMSLLQPQEAVAVLIADPTFLPALNVPLMDWKVDVTNLPIGTELYTSQPNDKAEIARLREALEQASKKLLESATPYDEACTIINDAVALKG